MAALAYLSILYVGPENAYKTGQDLYYKTAFTEKTDVTTQSLGEWIRGYSDFEEMERLASLTENNDYQNFEDISCAEILQTCHLNATALAEHNKVYIQKALKFHPDKFNNCQAERTLAEKAMIALARAKEIIKADKECPGQDEDGCLKNEQEATITRILQQPTSYFGKLIGAIPTCFLHVEGQERPVETSMHYCKDMV